MNKTLITHYPTPQSFHDQALKYFQPAPLKGDDLKAFYAECWTFSVYNFLRHKKLAGQMEDTLSQLFTEIALDYYQLRQKNYLWIEIEKNFANLWGTLSWKTTNTENYRYGKQLTSYGKQSEETQASPLLGDLAGATPDIGNLNKTIIKGFYQEGKFTPTVMRKV